MAGEEHAAASSREAGRARQRGRSGARTVPRDGSMITTLRSPVKAAAVVALMALAACAGPSPQSEADRRREQLAQAHQRASEALARGDYRTALRHYQLTLDRGRAVENQDESAISMLNIAAVLHRGGNYAVARSTLLALIEHEPPFAA